MDHVGARLGRSVEDTADVILQVATANMYAEFVPALAQHGVDPADFALFPYGGAGPTHAFMLADEVGLRRVIVPPNPGTLCALGCLVADLRADFVRTIFADCSRVPDAVLREAVVSGEEEARGWIADQQIAVEDTVVLRVADMRYKGQSFEIAVELPAGASTGSEWAEAFHQRYAAIYGYADRAAETEIINVRTTIVGRVRKPQLARIDRRAASQPRGVRNVRLHGHAFDAAVYDRADLGAGARFVGPAIVEQYDTTTFITPGWTVEVDAYGNLIAEAASHAD
jgi:N-methylhydantoinase A